MTKKTKSPKNLIKLKDLQEEYSKLNIMSTYKIEGTDKSIQFYQRFDVKKIEELIKEMFEDFVYVQENKIDFFNNDQDFIKYEMFLIIKHFSHFKNEIGDSFEDKIQAFDVLISTGLYDLFFEEIFDPAEVYEVLEKINKAIEDAMKVFEEQEKTIKEAGENIKNKDVIGKKEK